MKHVCVQLPTCVGNMPLPAFARCTPLQLSVGRAAIDRYILPACRPTAANLQQHDLAVVGPCWDRQMDGHRTVT